MKIDKSKFTAEELAQYENLIAKATVPEGEKSETSNEPTEEQKPLGAGESGQEKAEKSFNDHLGKMQARIDQMEKSLALQELTQVAEKYEIIGEKPEELAKTLYELKKSSETNYNAYLATLDKALALVQKSGLFTEIGKTSQEDGAGDTVQKIQAIAAELQKADPALHPVAAVQKAWELHPELVQEYEQNYRS